MNRQCVECGAGLSRYADETDTTCAPCYNRSERSYEEHLASIVDVIAQRRIGSTKEFCQRGHDLQEHGRMISKGDGTTTRRCMVCRRERERAYAQQRRARLKEAA
jgi:hypothetical protein